MDFYGEYHHTLDAKNRLFIPAKLREELGSTFYITRKLEKALVVYSKEGWQELKDKLHAQPDSIAGKIKQFIFPKTIDATPDSNGRVVLSAFLIGYADLGKNVVVVGAGDHVEIWNEDVWAQREADIDLAALEDKFKELGL